MAVIDKHWMRETEGDEAAPAAASHLVYRADIDGLRAVAVLPVVAFHLNMPIFRGGFVGVDVFFVISGYLITGILLSDFAEGGAGWLRRFYMRRARRILPALLAMMAFTLFAGCFLLFPGELAQLARNALAALIFSSNLYLYAQTNYFASGSEANALLHTWSLAVEEQYYLFYPPLLFLVCRRLRDKLPLVLLALTVGGFVACVRMTDVAAQAAFYLTPFRVWELAAGGLLAALPGRAIGNRLLLELLSLLGLGLIVGAASFYYPKMGYPGAWAAAPVLGAALLIATGATRPTLAGALLASRPVVFTGRISYSLYLWHWPLYVLVHLSLGRALALPEQMALLALILAVSFVSWRYVEQPFRGRAKMDHPGGRGFALRIAAMSAALGVLAGLLIFSGGLAWRFDPAVERLAHYADYDDVRVYRRGTCFIDSYQQSAEDFRRDLCLTPDPSRRNVLLIGDSHAAHLWKALQDQLPGVNVLQATASGCKPFPIDVGQRACTTIMNDTIERFLPEHRLDGIIISAEWNQYDLPSLAETLETLKRASPHVYLAGPIIEYNQSLARLLAHAAASHLPAPGIAARTAGTASLDAAFEALAQRAGVTYLSTYRALCATQDACLQTINGVPVQWDQGHLTAEGAAYIIAAFRKEGAFAPLAR